MRGGKRKCGRADSASGGRFGSYTTPKVGAVFFFIRRSGGRDGGEGQFAPGPRVRVRPVPEVASGRSRPGVRGPPVLAEQTRGVPAMPHPGGSVPAGSRGKLSSLVSREEQVVCRASSFVTAPVSP